MFTGTPWTGTGTVQRYARTCGKCEKKEEKEKEQKWEERGRKKLLAADAEQSREEEEGWDGVKSHQDVCNSVPPAAAASTAAG